MFNTTLSINGREIGPLHPPYVIAELSGNHKGHLSQALAMIDAAAATRVDAIKIQTYSADTITLNHDGPEFQIEGGLWGGRTLYNLYQEAHTPWSWHEALFERAKKNNITLFSSPFDKTAIELLESLNCPAYKIASFEINDIGLITAAAKTGKPIIMSTGLATLEEINEAVSAIANAGGVQLALLHCISGYPTPLEDCNLRTIADLCRRFDFPIGLSDHTIDNTASIIAVGLGASVIEKHFTLDKTDGSVDSAFSLEPNEFATLKQETLKVFKALGTVGYDIKPSEAGGRDFRRSLYVSKAIKKGEHFTEENIRSVRPAKGLHTRYLPQILEQTAITDIAFGTPLSEQHLSIPLKKQD
ncbi:pseudaminic acid synthase [Shewanella morhuae]|uniref:Pseudaminic acid synthase n=1 Tax=Shewanella morhuae TaxID=365591 RepID=A0A380A7U5_9GAMM|nr:pseudaminic acid synthase [Shewanella morhuae]PTA50807.1 pseudaminic acid synthase [Shewanella morhuae]SUI75983.1 Spore coat polysaccharide biosynthesis protein spsE [Shewanella morhuae]